MKTDKNKTSVNCNTRTHTNLKTGQTSEQDFKSRFQKKGPQRHKICQFCPIDIFRTEEEERGGQEWALRRPTLTKNIKDLEAVTQQADALASSLTSSYVQRLFVSLQRKICFKIYWNCLKSLKYLWYRAPYLVQINSDCRTVWCSSSKSVPTIAQDGQIVEVKPEDDTCSGQTPRVKNH